jgi:methylated-DNA-[protein]-cysteine S-methyltransferase
MTLAASPAVVRFVTLDTQFGEFYLGERDDGGLVSTWWSRRGFGSRAREDRTLARELVRALRAYFAGDGDADLSIAPTPPGPPFFRRCWIACRSIPVGDTWSYSDLAKAAGNSKGARAAGQAMRSNPLPVIVPCHRVVATGGALHGFGGTCRPDSRHLRLKTGLLRLEAALS